LILDVVAEQRDAGVAVVVTTHDLGEAAHADHVLLLSAHLIASGRPEEVLVGEHLASAYGQRLVQIGENVLMLDDAPHHPPDPGVVHPHPGHHHH
jgi:ABC-type Mn2+/Zn2+ transport system ATPase subunit